MRIKLLVHLTGTRNGVEWPPFGEEVDIPENEAGNMIALGMAELVSKHRDSEKAAPVATEARAALVPKRTLKGRAK